MNVELRGTIRAALGTATIEVAVPPRGMALSRLLEQFAQANPRARRYLDGSSGQAVLRAVLNGAVVTPGRDPLVLPGDSLMLLHAVAGGAPAPARGTAAAGA